MISIKCPRCSNEIQYVTVQEAAKLAKVNPTTIKRWIAARKLKNERLSERIQIVRVDDLRAMIEKRKCG